MSWEVPYQWYRPNEISEVLPDCWFQLECSHVRNNLREYVDLCRAIPSILNLRILPSRERFRCMKRDICSLGLCFQEELLPFQYPKLAPITVFRASPDCKVYTLHMVQIQNTITIHMSSSPPVTSMYTSLSEDIMWLQRCEPTTLAKRSALDFVYKTVHVTGLVCESEWLFLVSIKFSISV